MRVFRYLFVAFTVVLLVTAHAAKDPGGGSATGGVDVSLTETADSVTLTNGVITAVMQKSTGKITSYVFNGTQMVDPANPIYYSMDGGPRFAVPDKCIYSLVSKSPDMIHVRATRVWNPALHKQAFDIELNYILRRGDTGLYAYAVLDHPAAYPATEVGEWRIVWKLPHDSAKFTFERAYVDAARNWEMPSLADYKQSSRTPIAEIVKLNTGVRAGHYDGKYSYAACYFDIGTWGHASNLNKKGVWFVLGGHDYFNDGPTHQDLTTSESYILMHFGRNHFGGSGTAVAAGEAWRKVYGPFLLYCNQTSTTSNAGDALWADARAQVAAERAAWPYDWLRTTDHPPAAERGTVTGKFVITDTLKPSVSAAGAWVGLAAAEATAGNWQRQSKGYQYWTRADAAGRFTITAIRPGTYTLYAFNDGSVGEFSKTEIAIAAGRIHDAGTLTWTIANPGGRLAWEIGVPDRTAREFRHGDDYFEPFLWEKFTQEFPNPLVYIIGQSTPARDWNYAHTSYRTVAPAAGTVSPEDWNWQVRFELADLPARGEATLTIAFASAHYPRLWLFVNDEADALARVSPPVSGGNALLRQGIHAKYSIVRVPIPVSRLREGTNTFTFRFSSPRGSGEHVMYDYLSLHLPDSR